MKKILVIGPVPEPTTGVSLANQVVIDHLTTDNGFETSYINTSFHKFDENLGSFSIAKLFFYLKLNFYSYKIFNVETVYITPGQTFFGVLKYAFFILITKLSGKELIAHIHGNHVRKEYLILKGFKKRLFKVLLSQVDKGIVLSEMLIGNMSPFIANEKIFIVYNFVQDYLFNEEEVIQNKLQFDKPKIIFLSNLMEEKGVFEVLEALKYLENEGFNFEAKIAGNIDERHKSKIHSYLDSLQNVEYCGVVSGQEKKELLCWGTIFVLPTYYAMEGQPISILEAMAAGNLILTTSHAGIPDIFEDGINGYFVEKQNIKSIVTKIKFATFDKNNSDAIRLQNYRIAKSEYTVKNFIKNIERIFRN